MYKLFCRIYQKGMFFASFFLDWKEPELLQGAGSVLQLPRRMKQQGLTRALLVTDPGISKLALPVPLMKALEKAEIDSVYYDKTQANPTIQDIEDAFALYRDRACDCIIAFGGGSSMDCAKGVGARVARPNKSIPQLRGLLKVRKKLPPLFAIPTTAGTGSECTLAAVVTDPATHEKYALNDPHLRPRVAVLDPLLTVGLPPHITAATGMDALTHAVEAILGKSNTKFTQKNAILAIQGVFRWLEQAYENGQNLEAREEMLLASYRAGLAFTRAYVGNVHAIAHNLGGLYHVPHGLANAVILPHMLDFYGASAQKKLEKLAKLVDVARSESGEERAKAFIQVIRDMNVRFGIPEQFDCIEDKDIPIISKRACREANPLYPVPRIMSQKSCKIFIKKIQK